ncbi:hypothetical protein [Amycolatopsis sp. NPDC059657]|uniref:hypothetical protein n=1 Tax=Amycolatopsis sp. NPDC059657 TaxID=3346899 RepID=UPI0036718575
MKKYRGYSRIERADAVLWKPGIDPDRLRWKTIRWRMLRNAVWPWPAAVVGFGGCAIVLSESTAMSVLGIALSLFSVCFAWLIFACDRHDPQWAWTADRLVGARHGELFHQSRDFTDLPCSVAVLVGQIILTTDNLRGHQGVDWLGSCLIDRVHALAWETVSCVDKTRELREWVSAASEDAELAEQVRQAEARLAEVDQGARRVAECLRQVLELADAWTEKLRLIGERAELLNTFGGLELPTITPAVCAMEEISESVFSYVTAARDLLGGGPFAWESH